uniref:Signal transducer CD24 n=1 Tax=Equus asinus TaxID=9793 RepID=A0A9L0IW56_EQUAS
EPWRPAPASLADQPAKSTRGAAPSPRQARGPHKARTVPLPLGREFENSRAEGAPGPGPRATRAAVRAVGGGCAPHPRRRLLFRWGQLAGPALHLSCAGPQPAVLHAPSFQRYVSRADGVDMGRAMVARLGLGLLLLALLLPTQIYSNQTTVATTSSNSSQSTSAAPNPATATTHSNGGTLQSTASLFVISFSLLHLYC